MFKFYEEDSFYSTIDIRIQVSVLFTVNIFVLHLLLLHLLTTSRPYPTNRPPQHINKMAENNLEVYRYTSLRYIKNSILKFLNSEASCIEFSF